MSKEGYVYILSSPNRSALYTGVTSDLTRRVYEHKNKLVPGFTTDYNCVVLVYFCRFDTIAQAIAEEKRIKGGSRLKKLNLIDTLNPSWDDLYHSINGSL